MRELLSGALPAPQDEPPQRDVIDEAMDWGARRRRRDWTLTGAAALAVVAVATGVAAVNGGGGGSGTSALGQSPTTVSTHRSMGVPSAPNGSWWTASCGHTGTSKGDLGEYCGLFAEQQNFNTSFANGSAKYIRAALPAGFTVRSTDTPVLILTALDGKTNYLFPSAEPASTLEGKFGCSTPPSPNCIETKTAGGTVVVNSGPSGAPSAGYVGQGQTDPRVDILLGTSVTGGLNGMAPPTSATPLLTGAQLTRILSDPGFLTYAKEQLQHLDDITRRLQALAPPSVSGASVPSGPGSFSSSSGPTSGATGSWSPPLGWQSSPGDSSWSPPSGPGSSESRPSWSQSSSGWSPPSYSGPPSGSSFPAVPESSGS